MSDFPKTLLNLLKKLEKMEQAASNSILLIDALKSISKMINSTFMRFVKTGNVFFLFRLGKGAESALSAITFRIFDFFFTKIVIVKYL